MPDYRLFYDANALSAHHLQGKPQIVVIKKWIAGKVGHGAKAQKKPVLYFENRTLPLAINKTNGATIATLYGRNLDEWIGKSIEIYPTTTQFGKDTVDCIRVKPRVPTGRVSTEDPQPTEAGEIDLAAALEAQMDEDAK